MKYHVAIGIERALQELGKGNNLFEPATPLDAFQALMDAKDKGFRAYTGCDNVNSEGLCAGHKEI